MARKSPNEKAAAARVLEALKAKGIIKRTPEEIQRIVKRAVKSATQKAKLTKEQSHALREFNPPPIELIRWKEIRSQVFENISCVAHVGGNLVIKITRNPKTITGIHTIAIHTLFDTRKGQIILSNEPIVSLHWSFNYYGGRQEAIEKIKQYITDYKF